MHEHVAVADAGSWPTRVNKSVARVFNGQANKSRRYVVMS